MLRSVSLLTVLTVLGLASPVMAADWGGQMRESYPEDWTLDEGNPLSVDFGARYWYSMGQQRLSVNGNAYNTDDTSHLGELFLKVDDPASGWYGRGVAGYSAVISNAYARPGGAGVSNLGHISYYQGDLGYRFLGDGDVFGLSGFGGYQYWNDSPDVGGTVGTQDLYYNMLRLGLSAKLNLGDVVELTAEGAIIPVAQMGGRYDDTVMTGAVGSMDGWLYGAAGEVMARVHIPESLTVGIGARAWYLTGQAAFSGIKSQEFSTLRYGLLGEVSYKF